jgi:hypothetical protein
MKSPIAILSLLTVLGTFSNGAMDAFAPRPTALTLDLSAYFAP